MEARSDIKTIMCSVLFLDIVEYSRMSVAGQISLKDRFNNSLSVALSNVPATDRIVFNAEGGAVVNFIGAIDDALNVALGLHQILLNENGSPEPSLRVRMGINLGPVRLVRDINGQPDIVGDGINVAQRLTGFAQPNQILVSRAYYDAVLHLFPQHAALFHYQGARTDNHLREHEVYAVGDAAAEAPVQAPGKLADSGKDQPAILPGHAGSTGIKKHILLVGVVAAFAGLIAVLALRPAHREEKTALPTVGAAQVIGDNHAAASSVAVVAADAGNKMPAARSPQPATTLEPDMKKSAGKKTNDRQIKDQAKHPDSSLQSKPQIKTGMHDKKASTVAESSSTLKGSDAAITITCDEGTTVFVDGVQKGRVGTEPLTLVIPPGKHLVIVNHASGNIYSRDIDLEPGKTLRIRPYICK